ncbi:hypothetical protein ABI36_0218170 [Pseudomonas aeruginosa]|nr:hypothetical protein ABI36_0218170 [Pseudomonas aeruginosa]
MSHSMCSMALLSMRQWQLPLRSRRHMTLLLFYVLMSALCGRLRQRCLRHLVDWPIMLKM